MFHLKHASLQSAAEQTGVLPSLPPSRQLSSTAAAQ